MAGLFGELPRWIQPVEAKDECFNGTIVEGSLPYGLRVEHVRRAMVDLGQFIDHMNQGLAQRANARMEELLPANGYSGILSEVFVRAIAASGTVLIRNLRVGGHPDLLPAEQFAAAPAQLHAASGIEVKMSRAGTGWQGHNPETTWLMICGFTIDATTEPKEDRSQFRFAKVLLGYIHSAEWTASGRGPESRRTPTASVNRLASARLHRQWIYQDPDVVEARFVTPAGPILSPADVVAEAVEPRRRAPRLPRAVDPR
jgi:hypothetical protein